MKKRTFIFVLILVLITPLMFVFVGCGGQNKNQIDINAKEVYAMSAISSVSYSFLLFIIQFLFFRPKIQGEV